MISKSSRAGRFLTLFSVGYLILAGFIVAKRGWAGFDLKMALGTGLCALFFAGMILVLYDRG